MVVYKDPTDPTACNQILLLEEDTYFHSCILYITFLENSYFCHEYNCGHDQEKFRHHPSEGCRCPACNDWICRPKSEQIPIITCEEVSSEMFKVFEPQKIYIKKLKER